MSDLRRDPPPPQFPGRGPETSDAFGRRPPSFDDPQTEPVLPPAPPPEEPRRSGWRRVLVYSGLSAAALAAVAGLALVVWIWSVTRDLPSLETLKTYTPAITTRVYAGDGTVLGEYARERRIFVPIAFVPKRVVDAFTSAEDRNFFSHPGIDPGGILRAAVKDVFNVIEHKRLEGASTITQQVAKTSCSTAT